MKRFEVRCDDELFGAVQRLASEERRSINQQIVVLLTMGLAALRRASPAGERALDDNH